MKRSRGRPQRESVVMATAAPLLLPEWSRWVNHTARTLTPVLGGQVVPYWPTGMEKSVPEAFASDAEAAGLTRVS